ncbi:MAG: glycosyltransferase family 1 protein [Desulfovibrionaceae bacterium]|jgi:hypothetical protein|nr:glycosyltransferase family 1 protein [Desulfovibrionaceae bacterium]
MQVVHFSMTRLAGAPIRLVRALNALAAQGGGRIGGEPFEARLVDLERWGHYDTDVIFSETPEPAVELARAADVIHLHNYLDRDSGCFAPIDFHELEKRGARLLRHFHSTPELVASMAGATPRAVLECTIPAVVIAQYPERFYPHARVVPNLVPENEPDYLPCAPAARPDFDAAFTPTKLTSAWEDRWNTKGAPETVAMLETACRNAGTGRIKVVSGQPLKVALAAKRAARLVVDDLVNGSYHLSGLEGLCLGKPTLAWLDERSKLLLRVFSGSQHCPFVNVRLEDAGPVAEHLLRDPALCADLGQESRRWIENHWTSARHAAAYADIYTQLLRDPTSIRRQPELALDTPARAFHARTLPDLVYAARRARR